MPLLHINTNLPREKVTKEFHLNLGKLIAEFMDKPKEFIQIHLQPDQLISFGGTFEPCAHANIVSIGKLGVEENKKLSNFIMTELEKIGIPPTRVFILFNEVEPYEIGYNKTTCAELLK